MPENGLSISRSGLELFLHGWIDLVLERFGRGCPARRCEGSGSNRQHSSLSTVTIISVPIQGHSHTSTQFSKAALLIPNSSDCSLPLSSYYFCLTSLQLNDPSYRYTGLTHYYGWLYYYDAETEQQRKISTVRRGCCWKGLWHCPHYTKDLLHWSFRTVLSMQSTQSSLVLRFVNNDFQENKEPTIGGEILMHALLSTRYLLPSHIPDFQLKNR